MDTLDGSSYYFVVVHDGEAISIVNNLHRHGSELRLLLPTVGSFPCPLKFDVGSSNNSFVSLRESLANHHPQKPGTLLFSIANINDGEFHFLKH